MNPEDLLEDQERIYSQRTLELENKDETIQSNSYFYEETESQKS